jgi:hypothetical protein
VSVAFLFFLFAAVRMFWFFYTTQPPDRPEPIKIAISLVTQGTYADAYGKGVGPTAHTPPAYPLIAALLMKLAGIDTGIILLSILNGLASSLAFALMPVICDRFGVDPFISRTTGLAGAIPINLSTIQVSPQFETAFGALLFMLIFWRIARLGSHQAGSAAAGAVLGLFCGLATLFNPALLPVVSVWVVLCLMIQFRSWLSFTVCTAIVTLLVLAPWAIRNRIALGETIWTRSNLGLELDVSNHDRADPVHEVNFFSDFRHPFVDEVEREKVRQMGELAYMRLRMANALQWIQTHPSRFVSLTVRRVFWFWIPWKPVLLMRIYEVLLAALGIAGFVLWSRRGDRRAWFGLVAVLVFPAIYYVVQSTLRYRFPLEPVLLTGATLLVSKLVERRRKTPMPNAVTPA